MNLNRNWNLNIYLQKYYIKMKSDTGGDGKGGTQEETELLSNRGISSIAGKRPLREENEVDRSVSF